MTTQPATPLPERLREHADLPSTYALVGDKVEDLFDNGLRHQRGKKPFDYLKAWLSMLRPFAYATRDDSWGEMEKLLCIVMRNYVEMKRQSAEAADAIEALTAENDRLARAWKAKHKAQQQDRADAELWFERFQALTARNQALEEALREARGNVAFTLAWHRAEGSLEGIEAAEHRLARIDALLTPANGEQPTHNGPRHDEGRG